MIESTRRHPVEPRIAVASDAAMLVEFNQAMALETESKSLSQTTLRNGVEAVLSDSRHGFYVVAEIEREIVGSLLVTFEWSDWRNGLFWWIQSVYVRPDHRRRGIYRALHEFVRDRARTTGGVVGLRLYVERDNTTAQRTYDAQGMYETAYRMYEEILPSSGPPSRTRT